MTKFNFDNRVCSRCGGTKYFKSFSHVEGGRCFKCAAKGYVLTKKGSEAAAIARKALEVRADELEPGMRVYVTDVIPMTGAVVTRKMTVASVGPGEINATSNGEADSSPYSDRAVEYVAIRYEGNDSVSHDFPHSMVRRVMNPENKHLVIAALEGVKGVTITEE